jgi:hypothetical protein
MPDSTKEYTVNNQQKFFSCIAAIAITLFFAACGGSDESDETDAGTDPATDAGVDNSPLFIENCADPVVSWASGLRVGTCTPDIPNPNGRDTIILTDGFRGPQEQRVPRCLMKIWEGRGESIRRPPTAAEAAAAGEGDGLFFAKKSTMEVVLFLNPNTVTAARLGGAEFHCPIIH